LDQATALIISDDADFSRAVMDRWQSERNAPAFTLMGADICRDLDGDGFDLAIVGALPSEILSAVFKALDPVDKPVLWVRGQNQVDNQIRQSHPGLRVLQQREGWLDTLVLVATEILLLGQATARALRAEHARKSLEQQAALGRYMLEMRHTLNNSLTSVLGNSELLLLEYGSAKTGAAKTGSTKSGLTRPRPIQSGAIQSGTLESGSIKSGALESGALSPGARSQLETIRNMAERMHEILRRFSSIEKEMNAVEKQAENEARTKVRAAGASS
jgi:signal transduction histidine kinase